MKFIRRNLYTAIFVAKPSSVYDLTTIATMKMFWERNAPIRCVRRCLVGARLLLTAAA